MALNPLNKKKKPLSGAARRKLKREQERAAAGAPARAKGEYIERDPENKNKTEQWSHDKWRVEMRLVYMEMRKRKIPLSEGTSLIWAADVNARLAKMAEELAYLKALNEQLAALQGGLPPLLTAADHAQLTEGD